ncbi:MAG: hypothetical protein RL497_20 [Pseudomonadota bacterium]|jgi:hypothetical protein
MDFEVCDTLTPTLSQRERELTARTLKSAQSNPLSPRDNCMDAGGRVTLGAVTERARVREKTCLKK